MRLPMNSNHPYMAMDALSNSHHPTSANATIQSRPSKLSRVILSQHSLVLMTAFPSWDALIPQTILTLNLLHQSNAAPKTSFWWQQNTTCSFWMCSAVCRCNSMSNLILVPQGENILWMASTTVPPLNTIAKSSFSSRLLAILSLSNTSIPWNQLSLQQIPLL